MRWRAGFVFGSALLVAACGPSDSSLTSSAGSGSVPGPSSVEDVAGTTLQEPLNITELSWDMFVEPEAFGPGYSQSERNDYMGPAEWEPGQPRTDYLITGMDDACRPTTWTTVEPTEWAFRWFDAPDGGLAWEDLLLMPTTEDAAAAVEAARLTLGESVNNPACNGMNLIAPRENAEPDQFELTYPVYEIEPDCPVGDDCHAVVTELNPCTPGPDGDECFTVTQIFAHVGPVTISVMYQAPEGVRTSVPIEELIAPAQEAAELVRAAG